jgi:hypothetical protein
VRGHLAALILALAVCACSPAIKGVDEAALTDAVGGAIGDPNTCVMLVNRQGDVVWQFGNYITCARELPACDRAGGVITAEDLAKAAAKGDERAISCPSRPDGSTDVAWASGPVTAGEGATHEPLAYAAVMEGERALPGREIKARLERALAEAGL